MSEKQIIEQFNAHVMPTYGRYPLAVKCGEGRTCESEDSKRFLDFGSGIGTNSLGFCDEAWADAVCAQVRAIQHTSNYYYTKVQADFAEQLCSITGYSKVFFGNSGAEANECAIKLARKYSFDKYGKDRHTILTLVNSFHGRTLTTLSATGQESFHNYFFPFTDGFRHIPANDMASLEANLDDTVCAVMLEFVQGEGGVIPLEQNYVDEVFRLCGDRDILVIADEVQTGVGRTGRFLAAEHYGVLPDVTTLAKGLAGGIPIGVCAAKEVYAGVLSAGTHGSTFGGNPIACAGGLAVLERLSQPGFLMEVAAKGDYFHKALTALPGVEGVDGLGLMIGIRLQSAKAPALAKACLERGLLVLTAKEKLRLLPPLTITYEEIDEGLAILRAALEETEA